MTVDEFIQTIEEIHLDEALTKLAENPKDLIAVYLNAKEFQRSKLVRSNYMPEDETEEKNITIKIISQIVGEG